MKPIEFLTDIEEHNARLGPEMFARTQQDLIITDGEQDYEILSYYWTYKGMVIDIQPSKKKKLKHRI